MEENYYDKEDMVYYYLWNESNLLNYNKTLSKRKFVIGGAPYNAIQSHYGTDPRNPYSSLKQWHFRFNLN